MRNTATWRADLAKELSAFKNVYGPLPMSATEILDTELILTVMKQAFPEQNPELAWAVLNGHHLPALEGLSEPLQKAITLTRLHLPWLIGRRSWEDSVRLYRTLSSPYPLYRLEGWKIIEQTNTILPERREAIQKALSSPPEWKSRKVRYAPAGRYRFSLKREWHEVELPPCAEQFADRPVPRLESPRVSDRQRLDISLAALQDEADWMDRVAPEGSAAAEQCWGKRIRDIQLRLVDASGLQRSTLLTLDGLLHLIGMVGSGKSTLFTVLAVYLARRGYRVTIVQSDVASLFREQAIFDALRQAEPLALQAVPLLGRSTRITHLNRLYRTEAVRDGVSLRRHHPAYPLLSTICPLDGLRQDVRPIQPGEEPCTRLYLVEEDEDSEERLDCPFMPVCPGHHSTRALADARIWLATPASLLASGPQAPLVQENVRNIDLVLRHAHVVLIDEADLVQVQFDDRFAPMEVLVRERGESWLDQVATQVTRHVYRSGRPLVGQMPGLDRWLISHDNTQRAVNRLYILLRNGNDSAPRRWLGNAYFSHDRLIARLVWELRDLLPSTEEFVRQAEYFKYSPLVGPLKLSGAPGSQGVEKPAEETQLPPEAWYQALHLEMLESDTHLALLQLQTWLRQVKVATADMSSQQMDQLALHLLIMLLVITLDHALQAMILQWPAVEGLDIDRGTGGLFYHPSEDQLRMVPEPPMGAVLGFQYFDSHGDGNGELRFFHVRGMGRSLLYHLHDTLKQSDDLAGPHVIITSGTSWAPGSWKYHLHEPPRAVLLPQQQEEARVQEMPRERVHCFFDALPDPDAPGKYLRVSGIEEPERRMRSLRAMVEALTRPQAFRPSMLDAELDLLEEQRRRILLVVGSYDEAEAVGETLATILAEQRQLPYGEEVLTLIPDSEGEGNDRWQPPPGKLLRSLLNQMPKRPARFLVAPLQSIERGHNILVGQEAAIGSVYFLVRPYPVPGDIYTAIHKLNAWAMDYVPTLADPQATRAGTRLRQEAAQQWDLALGKGKRYRELKDNDLRTPLLWTQFVLVWQCIGRLLRGGASARVHFVDARWAENSPTGQKDTEKTSMLLGFRRILQQAISDPDPARRAIATTLYGEAARAFSKIQGVYHA